MKKSVVCSVLAVTFVILLLVILVGSSADSKATVQPVEQPKAHIYTNDELLAEANRLRAEKGVAPLRIDERLKQSAQWKADDMKEFNYYGHVKPGDTRNNGTFKAIELTGSDCSSVSENLDGTYLDESPFENEGWISSKAHYDAEINPRYDTTGFASVQVGNQRYYVQHFCELR